MDGAERIGFVTFEPHRSEQHRSAHRSTQRDEPSAAALLLNDAADALVAYARMAAREAGSGKAALPELMRTSIWPGYEVEAADGRDGAGARPLSQPCDALVCTIDASAEERRVHGLEEALATACTLAAGNARVYAIVAVHDPDGFDAMWTLQRVATACAHDGLLWSGGLVVTDAELIPRLMRTPRLGAWRRPVSEAIDRLVAAVRLNCSLSAVDSLLEGHTANGDSSGYLIASPNHLWRSIAGLVARHTIP